MDPISGDVYSESKDGAVTKENFDLIIGADGARSVARQAVISDASSVCYKGETLSRKRKFLYIKPDFEDGPHSAMNKSAFFDLANGVGGWWYIHPYKRIHLTTNFFPKLSADGQNPLGLETEAAVQKFLLDVLGDVCINNTVAELAKTYLAMKPYSASSVFKINKYHHTAGKVVLVGDAAHTMSPALGQGMVSGISDVCFLYESLKRHKWTDIPTALLEYSNERVPQGNAITDLNNVLLSNKKHPIKFALLEIIRKRILGKPTLRDYVGSGDYKSAAKT